MPVFRIQRRLHLRNSAPVARCVRVVRAFPATRVGQNCISLSWRCEPSPDGARETTDEFGNHAMEIRYRHIARDWTFHLEAVVRCDDQAETARDDHSSPSGIGAWLLPSARCDLTSEIAAVAKQLQSTVEFDRTPFAICDWTHRVLRYDTSASDARATASQALARGAGVCQDYAHLMIALCRAAKIPARYVAGYIPSEGAMHAWCEVLVRDRWLAFDPTHNRRAQGCIFVATGRDYRDCAPLEGRFHGAATVSLESNCRVEECAETTAGS